MNDPIAVNQVPTFYFIGVSTGQSSSQRVFPRWMAALGRPEVQLKGVDCKIHDDPARYRQIVAEIKGDPLALGGLITTHKIDLLDAARDLIDHLGPYAQICDEVSCLSKRNGELWGHAVDPIADGRALDAITGPGYFGRTGGDFLCLGAGGAAAALALHLIGKLDSADRPRTFTFVDIDEVRLARVQSMIDQLAPRITFRYLLHPLAAQNDQLLDRMPPGSVVVNATGMGKDRPGSPITDAALSPSNAVAWELNYRGDLPFLQQAQKQQASANLTVADGWVAFLHGWTGVISQVLDLPIDRATFDRLANIAGE
ncbi:MAG: shikimate dehydrogenase, partial [Caldilineaceae bacterium]|nr:shikimate dehydrogenase [Caldilineaceae bacterium]